VQLNNLRSNPQPTYIIRCKHYTSFHRNTRQDSLRRVVRLKHIWKCLLLYLFNGITSRMLFLNQNITSQPLPEAAVYNFSTINKPDIWRAYLTEKYRMFFLNLKCVIWLVNKLSMRFIILLFSMLLSLTYSQIFVTRAIKLEGIDDDQTKVEI
jgi:hypothetical protein